MADIALLVVEEFEKRTRRGAPGGAGEDVEATKNRRDFGAVMKVCSSWAESASAAAAASRVKVSVLLKAGGVEEPKTGLSLAAFDGFFSA